MKLVTGCQGPLTKRKHQVVERLAQGMAVREIAAKLGLSPKTIHVHRASLLEKLDVGDDVELARRMFDNWQQGLSSHDCCWSSAAPLLSRSSGPACGTSVCI